MKYAVDRVVDNYVVLENLDTRAIIYINKNTLDFEVIDGDILVSKLGKYYKDDKLKESREDIIRKKMERLMKK